MRQKTDALERGVVLPIAAGEFILPSKLAADKAGPGFPSLIPPGMRAVSVRVNEVVSVAGFVLPGTRVDVLLTGNSTGRTISRPQLCWKMWRSLLPDKSWNETRRGPRKCSCDYAAGFSG